MTRTGSWIVVYNSGAPSVVEAQSALGGRKTRNAYNRRHVEHVLAGQEALATQLHGFRDLWVPIVSAGRCDNLLVSGPFSRRPWTADDIRQSWLELTGEKPRAQSARFLEYARTVLRPQVLARTSSPVSQSSCARSPSCWPSRRRTEARQKLEPGPPDFSRLPSAPLRRARGGGPNYELDLGRGLREWDAEELGVDALPTSARRVAGPPLAAEETLDLLVRAERFQLECVALARRLPNTMAAREEDTGACCSRT